MGRRYSSLVFSARPALTRFIYGLLLLLAVFLLCPTWCGGIYWPT